MSAVECDVCGGHVPSFEVWQQVVAGDLIFGHRGCVSVGFEERSQSSHGTGGAEHASPMPEEAS